MPERITINEELSFYITIRKCSKGYLFAYDGYSTSTTKDEFSLSVIEAAYNMLCWLLENNYIKTDKQ